MVFIMNDDLGRRIITSNNMNLFHEDCKVLLTIVGKGYKLVQKNHAL